MRPGRAEVRHELPRLDPPRQLLRPAAADPGALEVLGPRGQLAVEEHRDAELLADCGRGGERLGDGGAAPLVVEVDHGHHVERPHVRVDAGVGADVDARDRGARSAQQRVGHLALAGGEREHRPIVVGIGMEIEEARGREGTPDRLERGQVAALADVRHGHEERLLIHGTPKASGAAAAGGWHCLGWGGGIFRHKLPSARYR
jgi:hypothetical protein